MEFKREIWLDRLIQKKHNGLVKVITGIRRCGKSYLLFELFREHLLLQGVPADHIIGMSFDSFDMKKYRDPELFYPYIKSLLTDDGMYYLLFDEVQLLGEFESVLNGFLRMKNVDVYVTGSNAKFLSKDIITEFRGRGDELHIGPLRFCEFMENYSGNRYDGWQEYMLYGGLPQVVLLPTAEQKAALLKSLMDETYVSDIVGRHNVRNRAEMEDLLNILSSSIGSLTNPRKLSATFKSVKQVSISPNTIGNYLEYLCDAFLISAAHRYDIRGKKYIDTPLKYYFTDIGLRNARINFRQLEETHTMENVIYNELCARGFNVDVGIVPINAKNEDGKMTRNQLEVDFVCNKGSARYYIQSAFAMPDRAKTEQEQRPLLKIEDNFKKIIVTRDSPTVWYTEEGIQVMSIYDFLLNENSLNL
ncbi:MAG: ATP-binding protein [Clostridiales bacterium]|nr:ATP-binding protein [Clostridiales bacterium]